MNESTTLPNSPRRRQRRVMRVVQVLSWLVSLIFVLALVYAIYQWLTNGTALPLWAVLGSIAVMALIVGVAVAIAVYVGMRRSLGPFDMDVQTPAGAEIANDVRVVPSEAASTLRTEIEMTAGILELSGGARSALDATFIYDRAEWRAPETNYSVDAQGQGALRVYQHGGPHGASVHTRNEWQVRLNSGLPTELAVKLGAGKANLALSGMNLTRLKVQGGVGALDLGMRGDWKQGFDGEIKCGIGDVTVHLPQNVGVRVEGAAGLGQVQTSGLLKQDDLYVNGAYGHVPVTLNLIVERGIGAVKLIG